MLRRDAPLKATAARRPESIVVTAECADEANALRAYCEKNFSVGKLTAGSRATELTKLPYREGYPTAEAARIAAQCAFDGYAKGKTGVLYWRTAPAIAMSTRWWQYTYYMRLLISDKPRIS